ANRFRASRVRHDRASLVDRRRGGRPSGPVDDVAGPVGEEARRQTADSNDGGRAFAGTHERVHGLSRSSVGFGLVAAVVAVVGAVVIAVIGLGGGGDTTRTVRYEPIGELRADPLAFTPGRAAAFERAAAQGLSQVIYTKSPGGILAAAARTASFRPLID